jgi:hypothetical protein
MARKDLPVHREEGQAYEQLLKTCLSIDPHQDEKKLFSLKSDFLKSSQNLHKQIEAFKESLAKAPVSFLVLLWGEFPTTKCSQSGILECCAILLTQGY